MQEICLVIPCYNEETRLRGGEVLDFLRTHPDSSVCFVDDGSADGTRQVLEGLRAHAPDHVFLVGLPLNSGKAEAVRQGVLHVSALGRFAFIGYWDADFSTPLTEVDPLMRTLDGRPSYRLAMGSRVKRFGASIDRRPWRHVLGRVFSTCASWILQLPVYDSQCGAKVFRADTAVLVFDRPFITRWLFDVEILARLRNDLGRQETIAAVIEVPLRAWYEVGHSKLTLRHMARIPFELLRISVRYNRSPAPSPARVTPAVSPAASGGNETQNLRARHAEGEAHVPHRPSGAPRRL